MHVLTFVKAARNCTELLEHGELSRAFHPGTRLRSSANWRANYNSQTCLSIFFSSSLWIVPQRRFAPRNLLDPLRSGFRSIRGELIVRLIARLFVWTRSLCLEISDRWWVNFEDLWRCGVLYEREIVQVPFASCLWKLKMQWVWILYD